MSYANKLDSHEVTVALSKGVVGTLRKEIPLEEIEKIQLVSTIKLKDGTTAVHIVEGNAEQGLNAYSSVNHQEVYNRFSTMFDEVVDNITKDIKHDN